MAEFSRLELPAALALLDGTRRNSDRRTVRGDVRRDHGARPNDRPLADLHALDGRDAAADLGPGAHHDTTRQVRGRGDRREILHAAVVADVADAVHAHERADVNVHGEHRPGGDGGAGADLEPAAEPDRRVHGRDEPLRIASHARDDASLRGGTADAKGNADARALVAEPVDAAKYR